MSGLVDRTLDVLLALLRAGLWAFELLARLLRAAPTRRVARIVGVGVVLAVLFLGSSYLFLFRVTLFLTDDTG